MPSDSLAPVIVITVITLAVAAVLILRGPLGRALGRRIEGPGAAPGDEVVRRIEDLERRLLASEQTEDRLAELEERLDFTERILAREKQAAQIQGERQA